VVNNCKCGHDFDEHGLTGICLEDCDCEMYEEEDELGEVEPEKIETDTRIKCPHGNAVGECLVCFKIESGRGGGTRGGGRK
jgi:hypothetical protein